MRVSLPYGSQQLTFGLPERSLLGIYSPNSLESLGLRPIADPAAEIRRALRSPVGAPPLAQDARGARRVVIAADDLTRQTPNPVLIGVVLDELNAAGISDDQVTVVIALGTHRAMTPAEIERHFSPAVTRRVRVVNNPWQDPAQMVDLEPTPAGTPVQVSRLALEADYLIGLGSIVPHHIPGYSAGGKIIQPGISGAEATGATHFLSTRTRRSYLGMVENPVRAEIEQIAARVGLRFILNTVLDSSGRVVGVFAGHPVQAHRAGVALSERVYGVSIPSPAEIVIAGSHPCDIEFWQAHKSLYPADRVVTDGGAIIVVTPCPEGVSVMHSGILAFTALPAEEIEARILSGEIKDVVSGALALAWAKMRQHASIFMVSAGISAQETAALGFRAFPTVDAALRSALAEQGAAARVAVLTHAPDMLPLP